MKIKPILNKVAYCKLAMEATIRESEQRSAFVEGIVPAKII